MNLRKSLFVLSIAATLMIAMFYVPPAGAAIRPVIIRPYHLPLSTARPGIPPGLMRTGVVPMSLFHRLVISRSTHI